MIRKLLLLFSFVPFLTHGQKEANIWYFVENAGINFETNPPSSITNGALNTLEVYSSFSHTNGKTLFYSDGTTVWDKNHSIMRYSNGNLANDLKGNPSSSRSGMIIPKPKSNSIYYLFTVDDGPNFLPDGSTDPGKGFNVYTIDLSLNSGLGQLIDEDNDGVYYKDLSNSLFDSWTEKVTAVRGEACNTFWIVSAVNNTFYAYLIDENGIDYVPIISTVGFSLTRRGYLKLSPDGSKLAIANQDDSNSTLFSFDKSTGQVANDGIVLTTGADGEAYGIEFSRNSKKVYVSTTAFFTDDIAVPSTYKLFQFDLNATNITNSKTLIHQQNGFRGSIQLGPDGKIYATIPQTYSDPNGFATHLDVITNPDANASDVVFQIDAVDLNGKKATQGLPPFISSLLLPIETIDQTPNQSVNDQTLQYCIGDTKIIAPDPVQGSGVTYNWMFNDGTTITNISNTRELTLSNITMANADEYRLLVELTDVCGDKLEREGVFKIEVYEATSATQPNDIIFCDTDNDGFQTFDIQTDITPQVLNGQDPAIFEIVYYLNQNDADTNNTANAISNPYTNPTPFSSQQIYARMHNILAPTACYDLKIFTLAVSGKPSPQTPTDYEVCDDTANEIQMVFITISC